MDPGGLGTYEDSFSKEEASARELITIGREESCCEADWANVAEGANWTHLLLPGQTGLAKVKNACWGKV